VWCVSVNPMPKGLLSFRLEWTQALVFHGTLRETTSGTSSGSLSFCASLSSDADEIDGCASCLS
jgi:hypothetical protein